MKRAPRGQQCPAQRVRVECHCPCGCDWTGRRVARENRTYAGGLDNECPRCSADWRACEAKGGDGKGDVA